MLPDDANPAGNVHGGGTLLPILCLFFSLSFSFLLLLFFHGAMMSVREEIVSLPEP